MKRLLRDGLSLDYISARNAKCDDSFRVGWICEARDVLFLWPCAEMKILTPRVLTVEMDGSVSDDFDGLIVELPTREVFSVAPSASCKNDKN